MSEIFKREDVSVDVENDIVVFRVGRHTKRFSYGSAFMIAQHLRVAANVAGRVAGMAEEERRALKRTAVEDDVRTVVDSEAPDHEPRWRVWYEGEIVAFQVADTVARWEAPAAMTIASWFREGGRQAKHWAGDTGQTIRVAGILTDASANSRLAH